MNNSIQQMMKFIKNKKYIPVGYPKHFFNQFYTQFETSFNNANKIVHHFDDAPKRYSRHNQHTFPPTITNYIRNTELQHIKYQFVVNGFTISVLFIDKEVNVKQCSKAIRYITAWLQLVCNKSITIYLYQTPLTKSFHSTNTFEDIVNTGYTIDNQIVVYRKEEWFKVFIHETFHAFRLDFATSNANVLNAKLSNLFKLKQIEDLYAYEAYTETWAEIVNVGICSFATHYGRKADFMRFTELYMNFEVTFGIHQLSLLLHYMCNATYKDVLKGKAIHPKLFGYFILKSILLTHYAEFIKQFPSYQFDGDFNKLYHFIQVYSTERLPLYTQLFTHPFIIHSTRMSICEM